MAAKLILAFVSSVCWPLRETPGLSHSVLGVCQEQVSQENWKMKAADVIYTRLNESSIYGVQDEGT